MPPDDGRMPKHVAAITSEGEKKNCCVDGPIIALLVKELVFHNNNNKKQ
jgi:hypothetical protein